MQNRNPQTAHRKPDGFTLVELLLVIGIIAVLMSLLIPAVTKVRIAGQKVATQGLINRISAACEAYFQDFNAYPGPFSDDDVISSSIAAATTTPTLAGGPGLTLASAPTQSLGHAPTSSENLFLGLCGGLRYVPGTTAYFLYDEDLAKRSPGPMSLNVGVAKKAQAYFDITTGDISSSLETSNPLNATDGSVPTSTWWPGAPGGPAFQSTPAQFMGDSRIFEFVDTFKIRRPILYMRAKRGVSRTAAAPTNLTGFIYDPNNATNTSPYQYDPTQIQYSYANTSYHLNPATGMKEDLAGKVWSAFTNDYPKILDDTGTKTKIKEGNERYFANEQLSTGNPTSMGDGTKQLVPQQKDKFMLISAGADGIYGTADDIRN